MDIKEAQRVVISKPVASRPTCSTFKSFSELLAGAINISPAIESSPTTVSAIRPKTVRFKPAMNQPPAGFVSSQADTFGAALDNSSDMSPKLDTKQSLIYKPTAKLVSKTTVSLLANMGNCSTNTSSNLDQSITPQTETNYQSSEPSKMVQQNIEEDQKALTSSVNCDRPSYDGYNWRKYGQKQVKMVMPWFNYGMEDSLQHGYSTDFFHEPSSYGVTMNELSASNNFSLLDRRNNCTKIFRDTHKHSSYAPVRSSVADIAENNANNVPSGSSGFSSLKMERQGPVMCSSSSTMMNFSHFAKPAAIVKANIENIGLASRSGNEGIQIKSAAATVTNPAESTKVELSGECPKKPATHNQDQDVTVSTKCDPSCKDVSKVDQNQTSNLVVGESVNKGHEAVEKGVELAVVSSSVCSGNGPERGSEDPNQNLKRKSKDTEDFESQSEDVEEESVGVNKEVPARRNGAKKSRSAEVHNLSERRRRDRINEKMRALQELIPNCNKADKASMLDEAIEYLKTLQLQLQIMSMGTSLCMPAMMLHPGMQHMHAPHMGPFSPIGVGMQMRLGVGCGMGMPDANDIESSRFIQVPQMQGTHHPSQGHPIPMPHAPIFSFPGEPFINPSTLGLVETVDKASSAFGLIKDQIPQLAQNTNNGCNSTNQMSTVQCEATIGGFEHSILVLNSGHATSVNDRGAINPSTEDNPYH